MHDETLMFTRVHDYILDVWNALHYDGADSVEANLEEALELLSETAFEIPGVVGVCDRKKLFGWYIEVLTQDVEAAKKALPKKMNGFRVEVVLSGPLETQGLQEM